jgi:MYXO-CTERM domain-containing protein
MRLAHGFAALVLVSACAEEQAPLDLSEPISEAMIGEPGLPGEAPRGVYIVQEGIDSTPVATAAPKPRIIYLNYDGGTYTSGSNNSSTNRSSIVSGSAYIAPWGSATARATVTACVEDIFSPFDITIVTDDPGDIEHIEAVTAGRPQDVGMGSGVGGVSPFSCGVINRSIVFSFAEVYGSSYQSLCHTVAQEAAHSFGLDHEYLCKDPMTYLNGCGAKTFQDVDAQCGEYSARACQCGGSTQNSVQMLLDASGPSGPGLPPDVSITSPPNGATVDPGFIIEVAASDDKGLERVELRVDGALIETLITTPYVFNAPSDLAPGQHTVEARAYDASDASSASIDVTVAGDDGGDECGTSNDCPGGFVCEGGNCVPEGFGDGETGSSCDDSTDCISGLCLSNGDESRCTETCADDTDCPSGTECLGTSGDSAVCWPGAGGEGGDDLAGGCSVGSGRTSGGLGALFLLMVCALGRLRRRTTRRQA